MLKEAIKNKRVLFITTKNIDYIRNSQEIDIMNHLAAKCDIIGSQSGNYFSRLFYVYWKLMFTGLRQYDVIFIGFAAQLVLPFIYYRVYHKYVIIDFFISMYDTFVFDRKKVSVDSMLSNLFYKLDKITLEKSNLIISDTKSHKEYFVNTFHVDENKIEVLYLEADRSIYYPRKMKKDKEKFLVFYFGSILPLQGVDIILDAACKIMEEYCRTLMFEIVGPISKELKEKYQGFDHITFINWLPQDELADHISRADLCIAGHFSNDIGKAKRTIPGKAYIYKAMDKKVIFGDTPANHELFEADEDNYFVETGNAEKLAEQIMRLYDKYGTKY